MLHADSPYAKAIKAAGLKQPLFRGQQATSIRQENKVG